MKNYLQLKAREIGIILSALTLVMTMQTLWQFWPTTTTFLQSFLWKRLHALNKRYPIWLILSQVRSDVTTPIVLLWMQEVLAKRLSNLLAHDFQLALKQPK